MRVVNETKNIVLSYDAAYANSFFSRARGLMLSKKKDIILVPPKEDIISAAIHMVLMLYPIDVVWLNSRKEVVDVKKNIQPFNPLKQNTWRIYSPKKPAKYVIELGVGSAAETQPGDKISFS